MASPQIYARLLHPRQRDIKAMMWGTHIGIPGCAALAVETLSLSRGRGLLFAPGTYIATLICGVLPDICSPHVSLEDRHHSLSHSIWFLAALVPLLGVAISFFPRGELPRWRTALLCWLAAALHVAMDAISGGVALLYPKSETVTGRYLIPPQHWIWWDAAFIVLIWVLWKVRSGAISRAFSS